MGRDTLAETAPAKINLYLHVIGRRPDSYHLLDSLVAFAGAADRLTAVPAQGLRLTLGGPFGGALSDDPDNLVLRAARRLAETAGLSPDVHLHLQKELPVASGIGGGSADAAATLRLLRRLWRLPPDFDFLPIAAELGADVPVCLAASPARMGGIGEILTLAPRAPACGVVLVNPGIPLPTASVFRARRADFSEPALLPASWDRVTEMAQDLGRLTNDLEAPAIELCGAVAEALAVLRRADGCRLARMSGSGATCFGLFDDAEAARSQAALLRRSLPVVSEWWVWGGALLT